MKWVLVRKLKQSTTKLNKTKLNTIWTETAKIYALSSGNVSKYEFLTGKNSFFTWKRIARKSSGIEKIWIFSVRQRIEKAN